MLENTIHQVVLQTARGTARVGASEEDDQEQDQGLGQEERGADPCVAQQRELPP